MKNAVELAPLREPGDTPDQKTITAWSGGQPLMPRNIPLEADSYKLGHWAIYPAATNGMFSYLAARKKGETIVPVGMQMFIKKVLLSKQITMEMIDEAEAFAKKHLIAGEGAVTFNRAGWEKVVKKYNGFLPLKIRGVREGTRVPSGNALWTIECTDPDLFWLASYIETAVQRVVWYMTTIASNDYKNWRALRLYDAMSNDPAPVPWTAIALHDFGGRGVTCGEQAENGGMSHLIYFGGSDTIDGVRAANFYYNCDMAAYSVFATEHSVQTAYGAMGQREYLETVIKTQAKPGGIVSIVIDGYDTLRETDVVCSLRDMIVASGAKVVLRPDSGDPLELLPAILRKLAAAFGTTKNSKGFLVINNVGVIWGDGVDFDLMNAVLDQVTEMGFAACNIVFGSGGALLQKVNRDTYSFAQKASAIRRGNRWEPIAKNPITDAGKKSQGGRLSLYRSALTGEYVTLDMDSKIDAEYQDQMVTIYENGVLLIDEKLDDVRARAMA